MGMKKRERLEKRVQPEVFRAAVHIVGDALKDVDELLSTGLYGDTRSDVAERIIGLQSPEWKKYLKAQKGK